MISLCPPALASLAIFTALIVLDITNKETKQILFHVITGIFSVIGLTVFCSYLGETAGWALFSVPFIVLVVGFLLIWIDSQKDPAPKVSCQTPKTPPRACPCLSCRSCPCRCGMNIPAPPPPVGPSPSCNPLPDSVTSLPPRKPESSLGCPPKN